jgi:hypothetical protein
MSLDPRAGEQALEQSPIKAAGGPIVDVFWRRLLA